ncbi:hypothetical protein FVEG_02852 [Fusarium verticillioides 7600]|uniref:Uncharacterized protein n=1 Tax=Gibberella moniliformis (strain M3125 / FGSC 7600) TaxID=334819 RepID=W7M6G0_GIBM7|nr:hypothetical protein FVEG_02852 [Fusarium verticillioides 7600]EWG40472.1 hypothetical protein FVEG_02852 [Fusarium verticillioides 7600]
MSIHLAANVRARKISDKPKVLLVKDAVTRHAHMMQTVNQAKVIIPMHCRDTSLQYARSQHLCNSEGVLQFWSTPPPRLGLYQVPTILVEPSSDRSFVFGFLRTHEEFEG